MQTHVREANTRGLRFKMFGMSMTRHGSGGLVGPWLSAAHASGSAKPTCDLLGAGRAGGPQSRRQSAAGVGHRGGPRVYAPWRHRRHRHRRIGLLRQPEHVRGDARRRLRLPRPRPADGGMDFPAEAFTMATEGSARVLGMQDLIGKIAKGYKADLVLLDLDHINFMPFNHAINQIVLTENGCARRQGADRRQAGRGRRPRDRHRQGGPRRQGRCRRRPARRAQCGGPAVRRAHRADRSNFCRGLADDDAMRALRRDASPPRCIHCGKPQH